MGQEVQGAKSAVEANEEAGAATWATEEGSVAWEVASGTELARGTTEEQCT